MGTTPNHRIWASSGEDPHKVTCILHSHHFFVTLHKKRKEIK
jgi:hypothetical protein